MAASRADLFADLGVVRGNLHGPPHDSRSLCGEQARLQGFNVAQAQPGQDVVGADDHALHHQSAGVASQVGAACGHLGHPGPLGLNKGEAGVCAVGESNH